MDDKALSAGSGSTDAGSELSGGVMLPGFVYGEPFDIRKLYLFFNSWQYRKTTYEILFYKKEDLADMIYNIAVFHKDLDKSVSIERFRNGAQGFHYSTMQIVVWLNSSCKKHTVFGDKEIYFVKRLIKDGVLKIKTPGNFEQGNSINHILGAAEGKKRNMTLNLTHEIIHVIWDQNQEFKNRYLKKWNNFSEEEKTKIIESFKGYDKSNVDQIIEEWAVKQNEHKVIGVIMNEQ
ncbi:MAG: hypothetical protein H7844_11950 [Nitrospirae bacterium YQR-1]